MESFLYLAENDSATLRKEIKTVNAIAKDIRGKNRFILLESDPELKRIIEHEKQSIKLKEVKESTLIHKRDSHINKSKDYPIQKENSKEENSGSY